MHGSLGPGSSRLDAVVERIRGLEATGRAWRLDAEEIRELLGVEVGEFYRKIYAADRARHPLVSLAAATASFSQDNIWEFVALVELFCGDSAERRFQGAGVFFPHPEQLELMGTFILNASRTARDHRLDSGEFSAMLAAFGSFERAHRCYLDEHFNLEGLVDAAVEQYCSPRQFSIPALARRNARALLEYFFQKHVLEPRELFAGTRASLFEQAVREGFAEPPAPGRPGPGFGGPGGTAFEGTPEPSPFERARRIMGLEGRPLTLPVLKRQYKGLMKRYHPDVNPAGLKRCQEINAAYALMVSAF